MLLLKTVRYNQHTFYVPQIVLSRTRSCTYCSFKFFLNISGGWSSIINAVWVQKLQKRRAEIFLQSGMNVMCWWSISLCQAFHIVKARQLVFQHAQNTMFQHRTYHISIVNIVIFVCTVFSNFNILALQQQIMAGIVSLVFFNHEQSFLCIFVFVSA